MIRILLAFFAAVVAVQGQMLLPVVSASPAGSAPKQSFGFYFRASALTTSPSPPAGYQFSDANDTYPVTKTINGFTVTYGWVSTAAAGCASPQFGFAGIGMYDGGTSIPRISGAVYALPLTCAVWRVDLPASGSFDVNLALGWDAAGSTISAIFYDGASSLFTVATATAAASSQWVDATGVLRTTGANWVSAGTNGGAPKTLTFTGTTLYLSVGNAGVADNSPLASMFIKQN